MTPFAKFLSVNGLKRKDIAAFLGVSGAFITQISSGDRPLPEEKLAMIKANAYGWDVSMLVPQAPTIEQEWENHMKILATRANYSHFIEERLSVADLLRIKEEEIIRLHKRIWELEQLLESKGGCDAQGADSSSDAHVG